MRHANEKHRVFRRLGGGFLHCATGMLLEHIVNVLHARDLAFANAIDAFIEPADRGAERNAVITDFPVDFRCSSVVQIASS